MDSFQKIKFLRHSVVAWLILVIIALIIGRSVLIPGISLGVLLALLNFSSLLTTLEQKEKSQTSKLTRVFFMRYLLVSIVIGILVHLGHLIGFLIGFISLYGVFFVGYLKQQKSGVVA